MYELKEINRDYAIYLLEVIIDYSPYKRINEIKRALWFLSYFLDKKKLFNYFVDILISHNWYELKLVAIKILLNHFPIKAQKIIEFILKKSYIMAYLVNRERILEIKALAKFYSNPIFCFYYCNKKFIEKAGWRYNYIQNRIFGYAGSSNLKLKIQSNGKYNIHNPKNKPKFSIKLNELDLKKSKRKDSRYLIIFEEKNQYGIVYRYFRKIISFMMKTYDIIPAEVYCEFYKYANINYLYVYTSKRNIEIVFPAIKI